LAAYSSSLFKREHAFTWALCLSIALHLAALITLPKFDQEPLEPPKVLTVEISQPQPVQEPQPKPEPVKPKIEPKPIPKITPIPQPVVEKKVSPVTVQEEPPPPPVATPAPKAEPKPTVVAQPTPPEPPKPVAVNQEEIDNSRNQYGSLLSREIAKYKQYPKIAQMRGWQGDVAVDIQIDGNGNVLSTKIHTSSGFESLDKQALEMVKKASPFPMPPAALRAKPFNVLVPVSFRLE
jgi:periplasmic protein TonB